MLTIWPVNGYPGVLVPTNERVPEQWKCA